MFFFLGVGNILILSCTAAYRVSIMGSCLREIPWPQVDLGFSSINASSWCSLPLWSGSSSGVFSLQNHFVCIRARELREISNVDQSPSDSVDGTMLQFSSVTQSCLTLRPHELQHSRPPCPSPTPKVYSDSCPLSWWRHPAISSSVVPFSSCPQSLPASGSFPMSQLFTVVLNMHFTGNARTVQVMTSQWKTEMTLEREGVLLEVMLTGSKSFKGKPEADENKLLSKKYKHLE